MCYRTFEEWKARGRYVIKGEKAMGTLTDGTSIFGKEQTKKVKPSKAKDQTPTSSWNNPYNCSRGGFADYLDIDELHEQGFDTYLPGQW